MSTYVSSNQPVGPERGTWVWLPLTPESNLATDFNNNAESSPFTTPIETMNGNNTTWVPADTSLFAPYPSSDMDAAAALLDQSLGLDVSDDFSPVLDTTNMFPTEAADADFAWMSQSLETSDLLELDPFLVAEIDRQVAEVPWDELLPASPLPDLAGLAAIDFPTAASSSSIWAPITPSPSASGPSPPPGYASPSSSPAAATATASFACPEPSCTKAFPSPHQLRKHERKHTRPFVCTECHKGHAAKKDLHRHLWVRHPEVAERSGIPCEVRRCHVKGCDFEGRQDNLKRHLRTKHR